MSEAFSVHDQPDFERVYDEDEELVVRRGDLRALLDVATGSLDFGSGFLDNEQVEVLRRLATVVGIDPILVTPSNFTFQYGCQAKGEHKWQAVEWRGTNWFCEVCRHTSNSVTEPRGLDDT